MDTAWQAPFNEKPAPRPTGQEAADDEAKKVQVAGKDLSACRDAEQGRGHRKNRGRGEKQQVGVREGQAQGLKRENWSNASGDDGSACAAGCKTARARRRSPLRSARRGQGRLGVSRGGPQAGGDATQDAAKKAIAAFDVLKGEARALKRPRRNSPVLRQRPPCETPGVARGLGECGSYFRCGGRKPVYS